MNEKNKNWTLHLEKDYLSNEDKFSIKFKGNLYGIFNKNSFEKMTKNSILQLFIEILNNADQLIREELNNE